MGAWLTALGVKQSVIVAGIFGSLVAFALGKDKPFQERAVAFLAGLPLAWYCGPLIAEKLSLTEKSELGVVCLTGATGIIILSRIVEALPELVTIGKDYLKRKVT